MTREVQSLRMSSPVKRQRVLSENGITHDEQAKTHAMKWKIFNDSVHGNIEIPEACVAIIDTPQFQRLRFIKQLGFCYYVYPGASHNRFEHSIGVCHLAGQMVRSLASKQSELGIKEKDIVCVEIAGLCHDLGHGPHSHMFDGKFIPHVTGSMEWKHEKASLEMFDYLLEDNGLMENDGILRKDYGLEDIDIIFIKELINGPLDGKNGRYRGRDEDKLFLYEIISNKLTGIDVDKWDYFARDCHHLGQVNSFDHKRFIKFVRVLTVNGKKQICARDKEIANLYQMFYTRYWLHRSAYQHKVSCACEIMAVDVLSKANDHFRISSRNGPLTMSECIKDMTAYMQLTDNVLWQIYIDTNPDLEPAKAIMKRLMCRDLYRCLDERSVSEKLQEKLDQNKMTSLGDLRDQMIKFSKDDDSSTSELEGSDFRLLIVYMDFGMKNENPLDNMWYYSKADPNTPKKANKVEESIKVGLLTPPKFVDNLLRVYIVNNSKDSEEISKVILASFHKLCQYWNIQAPGSTPGWDERGSKTPEKRNVVDSLMSEISAGKGRASMSKDD